MWLTGRAEAAALRQCHKQSDTAYTTADYAGPLEATFRAMTPLCYRGIDGEDRRIPAGSTFTPASVMAEDRHVTRHVIAGLMLEGEIEGIEAEG